MAREVAAGAALFAVSAGLLEATGDLTAFCAAGAASQLLRSVDLPLRDARLAAAAALAVALWGVDPLRDALRPAVALPGALARMALAPDAAPAPSTAEAALETLLRAPVAAAAAPLLYFGAAYALGGATAARALLAVDAFLLLLSSSSSPDPPAAAAAPATPESADNDARWAAGVALCGQLGGTLAAWALYQALWGDGGAPLLLLALGAAGVNALGTAAGALLHMSARTLAAPVWSALMSQAVAGFLLVRAARTPPEALFELCAVLALAAAFGAVAEDVSAGVSAPASAGTRALALRARRAGAVATVVLLPLAAHCSAAAKLYLGGGLLLVSAFVALAVSPLKVEEPALGRSRVD